MKSYTKLSRPGKVQNIVRIGLGMEDPAHPGKLVDYDALAAAEAGAAGKIRDNYDVEYRWGTLWMEEPDSDEAGGAADSNGAAAGSDGTAGGSSTAGSDGMTGEGELVAVTGDTDTMISDGQGSYMVKALNADEIVPLEKIISEQGGRGIFIPLLAGIILAVLAAAFAVFGIRKKKIKA